MKIKASIWIPLSVFIGALGWITYQSARERQAAAYAAATPHERGWMLMEDRACVSCHQPNSGFRAPILTGLYGKTVKLADGSEIIADDAYIKESIIAPMTPVVAGYQPVMPNYQGQFTPEELDALIAAMKPAPPPRNRT